MKAPLECPMCNEVSLWKEVDSRREFAWVKAIVGFCFLGPFGLLFGFIRKKKLYYCCGRCRFEHEYDG